MKITVTETKVVSLCIDAEVQWQLRMGDDDNYESFSKFANIEMCIEWGHENNEEADSGVLLVRISPLLFMRIEFLVNDDAPEYENIEQQFYRIPA